VTDLTGIIEEMADVRIYLEHLATHLGVDLDTACWENLRKEEKRSEESGPQPCAT